MRMKILRTEEIVGSLIGFFNRETQLGTGIITELHSTTGYNRTIRVDVLVEDRLIQDMVIMRMAEDGSLYITNFERLPYVQFLGDTLEKEEEKNHRLVKGDGGLR